MSEVSKGDPVQVRFIDFYVGEVWRPATVLHVERDGIGVAFANHERMMVANGQWRPIPATVAADRGGRDG